MGQTCSYILVNSGDTCADLWQQDVAYRLPTSPSSILALPSAPRSYPKELVYCSSGSFPTWLPSRTPTALVPAIPCSRGTIVPSSRPIITLPPTRSLTFNAQTWGWMGCSDLQLGANICLSTGDPPIPSIVEGTACGPQVAGTTRPSSWSQISSLNPCPLNACVGRAPLSLALLLAWLRLSLPACSSNVLHNKKV